MIVSVPSIMYFGRRGPGIIFKLTIDPESLRALPVVLRNIRRAGRRRRSP